MVDFHREFDDGISLAICRLFPNATIHQISNSLATRQVRTCGPGEFELYWTLFGYEDDTEEMTQHRLLQANLVGPAGLISMEDGEAIEITHRAVAGEQGRLLRDRDGRRRARSPTSTTASTTCPCAASGPIMPS